jgi:hypothetical protein
MDGKLMDEIAYIKAKMNDGLSLAEACMCRSIEFKLAPEYREGGSHHGYTVEQYIASRTK